MPAGTAGRPARRRDFQHQKKPKPPRCHRTSVSGLKMTAAYTYYNETRTHLSLNKDAPSRRVVQAAGLIFCQPILGGLHHQYGRI